jgi:GTP cyclohydrolase II
VPLEGAEDAEMVAFRPADGGPEHYALVIGKPAPPVLARIHSECFTGDLLGSLRCDCGAQLRGAIAAIASAGGGVVLYLAQEGRGIGLNNKLRAYRLQDEGFDTFEANRRLGFADDERFYDAAARMLTLLGITSVRLMTNNPAKVKALEAAGIAVAERVPHAFPSTRHNRDYLAAKKDRGHLL